MAPALAEAIANPVALAGIGFTVHLDPVEGGYKASVTIDARNPLRIGLLAASEGLVPEVARGLKPLTWIMRAICLLSRISNTMRARLPRDRSAGTPSCLPK